MSILAPKTGFGLNRDKLVGLNRVGGLTCLFLTHQNIQSNSRWKYIFIEFLAVFSFYFEGY